MTQYRLNSNPALEPASEPASEPVTFAQIYELIMTETQSSHVWHLKNE